jgi:hypothetical protein
MQVTRDIVIDLLPLYLADDVSDDTRKLVEHYLENDPKLQLMVREMQQISPLTDIPIPLNEEHEVKTFQKIKRLTFQHNLFLSLALGFSFIWFGGIILLNFDDDWTAVIAGPAFVLAIIFWIAFVNANKQLNKIE